MIYALLFFGFGFLVAVLCTPWVIRLAQRGIGLDYANESRKRQETPDPAARRDAAHARRCRSGLLVIFAVRPDARDATGFPSWSAAC